jgi:hypothetical protein
MAGVIAATTASAAAQAEVPDRLQLSPALRSYPWSNVRLREIDVGTNPVTESVESMRLQSVAESHSGTIGSVAFVVRRPG